MTAAAALRPVLFDLDGTLLDTAPDMVAALNRLRGEEGREPLPFEPMRRFVSHGSARLVQVGFPDADALNHERLRQRYLAIYREDLAVETRLFPGFEAVLDELDARSAPWGVVTNKPGWLTAPLLSAMGLAKRAGAVVSGDTLEERKPHPAPLLHAARRIGREPAEFVYLGDAERDVQAARAAGMRPLVARFGYLGPDDDPRQWQADGMIDSPRELLPWLADGAVATGHA
jgi:phosphoglycolate phosphatase